jgi:hypothetical protein
MFEKISSLQLKVLFALAGAVAAPIGEEIFFRGFLYNALKRRLSIPAAIVISGLVFAMAHFGPLAVIVIFPMGMVLAYVYERTRSLWVTIAMHATNNGLAFVLALAFPHLGEPKPTPQDRSPRKPAVQISVPLQPGRPAYLNPNLSHWQGEGHSSILPLLSAKVRPPLLWTEAHGCGLAPFSLAGRRAGDEGRSRRSLRPDTEAQSRGPVKESAGVRSLPRRPLISNRRV